MKDFPEEVMVESQLEDLQELKGCRMGLREETKNILGEGTSLNQSSMVRGSMAKSKDPNLSTS